MGLSNSVPRARLGLESAASKGTTFLSERNSRSLPLSEGLVGEASHTTSKVPEISGANFSSSKTGLRGKRTILDLSVLNKYIQCPKFRMTTTSDVRSSLEIGNYTTSWDIQDAFWNVPVHPIFSKYLGFILDRNKHSFVGMPFGLCIGPRVFTKLMNVVIKSLRLRGVKILAYLDDLLLWSNSATECQRHTSLVEEELQSRGFLINYFKSRPKPSQFFDYLGLTWDTVLGTISLPVRHRKSTLQMVKKAIKKDTLTLTEFQAILGKINFATIVDPPSKAWAKSWYKYVRYFKKGQRKSVPLLLRNSMRKWLQKQQLKAKAPLKVPHPSLEIFTNSSQTGWGYHSSAGHQNRGQWPFSFINLHINLKELICPLKYGHMERCNLV